jgi:hypothetical protein
MRGEVGYLSTWKQDQNLSEQDASMSDGIEGQLQKAEAALHGGVDQEQDVEGIIAFGEKYERVRKMFEAVLEQDPGNDRAKAGISACDEMLMPIHPVQCLAPPPSPDAIRDILSGAEPVAKLPWERRRAAREHQKEAMAYTGEVYSEAEDDAEGAALKIVEEALAVEGNPRKVLEETIPKIQAFQQEQSDSWKGYGPDVQEDAVAKLLDGLGMTRLEETDREKLAGIISKRVAAGEGGMELIDWVEEQITAHEKKWGRRHDELMELLEG